MQNHINVIASEAKQSTLCLRHEMDCFVALLLAMTAATSSPPSLSTDPRMTAPRRDALPAPRIVGILPANPDALGRRKKRSGRGRIMKPGRIGAIMGAWLALAAPATGWAQENFPSRPVRIVIPYAPGSVADVFARIIAQNMAAQWNGSIVVESKSGANGSIAVEEVA
jgi:hypothetical protein